MKDEYNTKIRRITTDRENLAEQKKKLQEKIESLESDLKTQAAKERFILILLVFMNKICSRTYEKAEREI